jgi:hypothetical protein
MVYVGSANDNVYAFALPIGNAGTAHQALGTSTRTTT